MNKKYYIYLALFNNLPFDVQVEKVLLSFDEFEINDIVSFYGFFGNYWMGFWKRQIFSIR